MDCFAGSDYDHYPVVDKNGMLMRMESVCRTRVEGGGRKSLVYIKIVKTNSM